MVGSTIGKYRVTELLGRGGMGTVYKAIDETLDRPVAIKTLSADLLSPDTLQRFRGEAVTLAKLNHPRIAAIHELTRQDHDLLMVMEFVNGETCEKLLARTGPLPIARAVVLCDQILDALEHAHAAGIVHRDLKPGNVMVTASGDVKVMDFGIARVAGTEHLTMEGFMMGTPAYMAPEQVRGEEVDRRMDLYATAVMLYRLVTSRLPFEADSPITMIHSQLSDPPTPPRQFRPDLPDWMDSILTRGLAKAAGDRFQSAADFRLALERGLAGALNQVPGQPFGDDNSETVPPMPTPTALRAVPNIGTAPQVPPAPSGIVRTDTSITLRTPHLAVAGVLLGLLVVGVGLLAYAALRRPVLVPSTASEPAATPVEPASASATGLEDGPGSNAQADQTVPSASSPGTATEPPAASPSPTPTSPVPTGQPVAAAPGSAAPRPSTPGAPLSTGAPAAKPSTAAPGTPQPPGTAAAKPSSTAAVPAPPAAGTTAAGRPSPPTSAPSAAPAPAAPASTSPSADAAGRGAVPATGDAGSGSPSAPNAIPESFGDIKTLVADGAKARELDALLILEPDRLVVRNRDNGAVLQTASYQSIAVATYARARQPRWQEDSSVAPIPKSFSGSGFFLKSSRHWLTLQSRSEFVILRLEDKNVGAVLASNRSPHRE